MRVRPIVTPYERTVRKTGTIAYGKEPIVVPPPSSHIVPVRYTPILVSIDGGGSVITTGVKLYLPIAFNCAIVSARLCADQDQSGSIVIDIWKIAPGIHYPPVDGDSITASAPPTLSSDDYIEDAELAGWTKDITAGDVLGFNVDSCTTKTFVTLELKVIRRD